MALTPSLPRCCVSILGAFFQYKTSFISEVSTRPEVLLAFGDVLSRHRAAEPAKKAAVYTSGSRGHTVHSIWEILWSTIMV